MKELRGKIPAFHSSPNLRAVNLTHRMAAASKDISNYTSANSQLLQPLRSQPQVGTELQGLGHHLTFDI